MNLLNRLLKVTFVFIEFLAFIFVTTQLNSGINVTV